VTRGYLNEPAKTEAAYLEDPMWLPKKATGEPVSYQITGFVETPWLPCCFLGQPHRVFQVGRFRLGYSMGTDPLTAASDPANLGHAVGTRLWVTHPENTT
jgi:hypothetical protein